LQMLSQISISLSYGRLKALEEAGRVA